jgi:diguanylate cyclase (GGDEF)-like protein
MKLRLKVLIILASMWTLVSLCIFIYSKSVLTNEYIKLENKEVADDLDRTHKTLQSLFSSLSVLTNDWSQWNDAYHFMENKNNAFIKSNMAFTTFENSKINLIAFFGPNGKLFYSQYYDLDKKQFVPTPPNVMSAIESEKSFARQTDPSESKTGILKIGTGYLILSSYPILTSEGKGPIAGTLVMGYFLTDHHLAKLSDIVKMQVHLFTLPIPKDDPLLNSAYDYLQSGYPYYFAVQSANAIAGFTFIRNIDQQPIGLLRIQEPRTLYNEGAKTIKRYLAIVVCLGIVFLLLVWYLLKHVVLDRVIKLSKQVADITSESKFSNRVDTSGKDEVSTLGTAINSLMQIVDLTEKQLTHRALLGYEEVERISKLNKSLYTEMSNQKRIETKLREGEKTLKHMAYYDTLTGLPNRLYLYELMQTLIQNAERKKSQFAILFLDADRFKAINDNYGHQTGDRFLQHIAKILKDSVLPTDVVSRLAGDEFILCLDNIKSKHQISATVDKILQNISTPLQTEHAAITSTFSVGIAIFPNDGITIEELGKKADIAMYNAKKQQTNSFCFYDREANQAPQS